MFNFNFVSTAFKNNKTHILVGVLFALELSLIHIVSDLPIETSNWIYKAEQIMRFQIPSDNFYGPGGALLVLPFLIVKKHFFFVNLFYGFVGAFSYSRICNLLLIGKTRFLALAFLFGNIYLVWLANSSQDTVFEFCLLMLAAYYLLLGKHKKFTLVMLLLSLTRSAYWLVVLIYGFYWLAKSVRERRLHTDKLLVFPTLLFLTVLNVVNYGSPSPALESGKTAYFSYSKYHYLSLPKMDMDVFLSGPSGIFSKEFGVEVTDGIGAAEQSNRFQKAAIHEAINNPKETLLGWMQKFDSYIFDVQKVPHLPGRYVLNLKTNTIEIQNERLTWPIVIGNFTYLIWRSIWLFLLISAVGISSALGRSLEMKNKIILSAPWLIGLIPALLFYSETRFKIVSELLLVPLLLYVHAKRRELRKT